MSEEEGRAVLAGGIDSESALDLAGLGAPTESEVAPLDSALVGFEVGAESLAEDPPLGESEGVDLPGFGEGGAESPVVTGKSEVVDLACFGEGGAESLVDDPPPGESEVVDLGFGEGGVESLIEDPPPGESEVVGLTGF